MDQTNLQILSQKISIAPEHILREFYEMAILQQLSETNFAKNLIFYGGTSLRLAYGGPRFSEDLDFLMVKNVTESVLGDLLKEVCRKYPELSLVEIKLKRNTLFGLLKINHPSLKHPRHIKIEICRKKNGIEDEYKILRSECSNFSPLIRTITPQCLEKLKLLAIKGRKEPRDWLDLWYVKNILKKPFEISDKLPFIEKEFKRELKRFLPRNKWPIIDEILKKVQK